MLCPVVVNERWNDCKAETPILSMLAISLPAIFEADQLEP
jgi:hypothetical protein